MLLLLHHHSFSSTKKNLHQLCDNSFSTFYWIHEFILKIQVFLEETFIGQDIEQFEHYQEKIFWLDLKWGQFTGIYLV